MVGTFQIEGQEFIALNGGPVFKFTELRNPGRSG
jgi:predicted 3-demethylubiquinone-9 3-methyltransferase (glyoxalase superfamily)